MTNRPRRIRLVHLDGKLPNLALMSLSAFWKSEGHEVTFTRSPSRQLGEPDYDEVYASAIFTKSAPLVAELRRWWPDAIVGGTWQNLRGPNGKDLNPKVSDIVPTQFTALDYSAYPEFKASLGFSQRGCRFRCSFCFVPWKEGRPNTFSTIDSIWRGPGHVKHLHILDNDFFGSPEWPDRIDEIRRGDYKVCLNQGVNLRIISDKQAAALASIQYRNDAFTRRVLYTAFDSLDDHRVFFRGVDRLAEHGIPPSHLMSYMLVGYEENETWERIWERFHAMTARGIKPYVMLHDDALGRPEDGDAPTWKALKRLQRWANMGLYRTVPWDEYRTSYKTSRHAPDARQDILL